MRLPLLLLTLSLSVFAGQPASTCPALDSLCGTLLTRIPDCSREKIAVLPFVHANNNGTFNIKAREYCRILLEASKKFLNPAVATSTATVALASPLRDTEILAAGKTLSADYVLAGFISTTSYGHWVFVKIVRVVTGETISSASAVVPLYPKGATIEDVAVR